MSLSRLMSAFVACFILSSLSMGAVQAQGDPEPPLYIIAHRGSSFDAPEETAAAYRLARESGADFLEADLHRTRDGVIVACHDEDLRRTTDAEVRFPDRKSYLIRDFTWAEIQTLDAGSWFNTQNLDRARLSFVDLRILSLDEVIDIAEGKGEKTSPIHHPGVYLEFKNPDLYPGIETQTVELLVRRGWLSLAQPPEASKKGYDPSKPVRIGLGPHRVIFQSYDPKSIARLNELDNPVMAYARAVPKLLLSDRTNFPEDKNRELVDEAVFVGATGIGPVGNLYGYHAWKFAEEISRAHSKGLFVHTHVFDTDLHLFLGQQAFNLASLFDATRHMKMGNPGKICLPAPGWTPDGLFTDRTDLALEKLRGLKGQTARTPSLLDELGYPKN